jgi:hypothetical protein
LSDDDAVFAAQDSITSQLASFMQFLAKQHTLLTNSTKSLTTDYFSIADLQ